jgi:haloalkane dehalogenase
MRSDFRCVAPDNIGYGLSDKPWKYNYDIQQHITNGIEFAEKMKFKRFHIIAQDFGVIIALAMAERWPERIGSMAFLNSYAFVLPRLPVSMMIFKMPVIGPIISVMFNLFVRVNLHFGTLGVMDDAVVQGYLFPFKKLSSRASIPSGISDIPWLVNHPSLPIIDQIAEKAFILNNKKIKFFWADDDFVYSGDTLQKWSNVLPNAQYKVYQTAGHYLLDESDEAISDIRTFVYCARNIQKELFK